MYYDDNEISEMTKLIERKKLVKRKKRNYVSRKTMAFCMVLCMMTSSAAGYAGGRLAADNKITEETPVLQSAYGDLKAMPMSVLGSSVELSIPEIAAKASDAVVEITTESIVRGSMMSQYITEGAGSGVIITSDGYIITNNHVIDKTEKITVRLSNGETYGAQLIATDSKTDVALIKIEADNLTAAEIGDSDTLVVGETAVAIGNPLGELGGTVTNGIISALDREINIDGETMNLLQTNAAINPGNSGGGLFNGKGQLIGLVVAKSSGEAVEGLGFAIPINDVSQIVSQLMEYGYVKGRVSFGMDLVDVSSVTMALSYQVDRTGVYVLKVDSTSEAQRAGFKSGDYIVAIGNTKISSSDDLNRALKDYSVGDSVTVTILRDGNIYRIDYTLQEAAPTQSTGDFVA